jgi:hypothetical protein
MFGRPLGDGAPALGISVSNDFWAPFEVEHSVGVEIELDVQVSEGLGGACPAQCRQLGEDPNHARDRFAPAKAGSGPPAIR